MHDPLMSVSTRRTPQSKQADARQVPNSAGGWAFTVGKAARLHRFLTLGTDGGTYYVSERDLTKQNAEIVLDWARNDASALVDEIVAVSQDGRAPRNNPALFALAAAAGLGDTAGRQKALNALPLVARTGTHLLIFARYAEQFRGWGRGLRRAVGNWFLDKEPGKLAYQMLKYRQREGWAMRDLLRTAHPFQKGLGQLGGTEAHRTLFDFTCGRDADLDALPLVRAFASAQKAAKTADWVRIISENKPLSWEMLPSAALTKPEVWTALLENGLPQTALMRQLPRLTRLGVIGPQNMTLTTAVAAQLADPQRLYKARVHPVNVLIALRTYASGKSLKGGATWAPVAQIADALDAAFYAAFGAVEPAGKRTLLAIDVSGSMWGRASGWSDISGLPLAPREAAAALALVTAATEPQVTITGFSSEATGIAPLKISPRQRMDDALLAMRQIPVGGTDCALPMIWAQQNRLEFDHISVYTDNETWAGRVHPHQALRGYRERMGISTRLSVVGMTATDFTIADPGDPGTLDVAGFDKDVPNLLADFARGSI